MFDLLYSGISCTLYMHVCDVLSDICTV